MATDRSPLARFLDDIASTAVPPAGGTVAATAAAMGSALCEMACRHTAFSLPMDSSHTRSVLQDELAQVRERLGRLGETDAAVVDRLSTVDSPSSTLYKRAVGIPLTILRVCVQGLTLATTVVEHTSKAVVPDVITGVELLSGAIRAMAVTVRRNLSQVTDSSFVQRTRERVRTLETQATREYTQIQDTVPADWQ